MITNEVVILKDEVMSNYREYGFKGMMPKPFDAYALGKALNDVF